MLPNDSGDIPREKSTRSGGLESGVRERPPASVDYAVSPAPEPQLGLSSAASGGGSITQGPVFITAPEESPFAALTNMILPDEVEVFLSQLLGKMGFRLSHEVAVEEFSEERHQFTLVTNDHIVRILMNIPDTILSSASRMNRTALKDVIEICAGQYTKDVKLFLFHESPPHTFYDLVLEEMKNQEGILIQFIPFIKFRDIKGWSEALQRRSITNQLQLEFIPSSLETKDKTPGKPRVSEITFTEMNRLADILTSISTFSDSHPGRRTMVESAGLGDLLKSIDVDDVPSQVAQKLIIAFVKKGIVEETGQYAIKMFLDYIIEAVPELPTDHKQYIDSFLEKYDFEP